MENRFVFKTSSTPLTKEEKEKYYDSIVFDSSGTITTHGIVYGVGSAESQGGVIYAEKYGKDLDTALRQSLEASKASGITTIDTRYFTGKHSLKSTITIDTSVKIIFGNIWITSTGENVFEFKSDNIILEGAGRASDKNMITGDNLTVIELDQSTLGVEVLNSGMKGYHIFSHGNKNCHVRNMVLQGKRTTLGRQCENLGYPIDGWGGIYFEPSVPCTSKSGNTCNAIILENLLINGTKAHGIYIDTPILSTIRNVRLSDVAGHGVFINSGTSLLVDSVYVASCSLAGFCFYGITYCSVLNSVAEQCGLGWWVRSSFNVSLFSPGVEHTYYSGYNLYEDTKTSTSKYGFNINAYDDSGKSYRVNDVPNDTVTMGGSSVHWRNLFIGNAFMVTGGRNIDLYSPYVTGIGFTPGGTSETVRNQHRYFAVVGNSRSVSLNNCGISGGASSEGTHKDLFGKNMKWEIEIGPEVEGANLTFNPNNTTLIGDDIPEVTSDLSQRAQILNLCSTSLIRFGNTIYTQVETKDENDGWIEL